ncbi:uncharacterized protein [Fopius arisanus]|uniref:Ycf1_1 protein n=1 Tax=Fopius arisanus TaxID=64838 RepID=A0A0C9RJC7_9HYME|nr:PREDICTED: uncharacterized protein LOC105269640 [Fopius arisanus]XP_011308350.1 PREDICTED: uncharacterized protein LOC105269640 [Fopius arisanus]
MAFQLDDLLRDDKRDGNLIPDLSKATCNSQEEFRRLRERCPEYKIKPEKLKRDDVKVRDKDFSWRTTKKELKLMEREWGYGDPIPPDMRSLDLQELQRVAIDWRMLTPLRPKLRADEEMFSRLVEMGKLELKTLAKDRRISISPIRRSKNRAGIIESSVKICGECGEEYCFGESCGDILYESFTRVAVAPQQQKIKVSEDTAAIIAGMNKGKRKKKKKGVRIKVSVPARKSARLGRRKLKKSKSEVSKGTAVNGDKNQSDVKTKKFKRKCTKHSKKSHLSPK